MTMASSIGYGSDGLSQLLGTNNAFGTDNAVNPWAAGATAFGLGLSQRKKAQDALESSGQVDIDTMGSVGRLQLDELLKLLGGQAGQVQQDFSKQAAQRDAMGLVNDIFNQYRNTALPTIYNAQTGSGAYNSTGAQMLANDAYGTTVNKAAQTVNKNVLDYTQAYQNQMTPLVQMLGIDKGSRTFGVDTRGQAAAAMQAAQTGSGATSSGLSTIGGAIGTTFGGPIGGIIGSAAGSILGSLF